MVFTIPRINGICVCVCNVWQHLPLLLPVLLIAGLGQACVSDIARLPNADFEVADSHSSTTNRTPQRTLQNPTGPLPLKTVFNDSSATLQPSAELKAQPAVAAKLSPATGLLEQGQELLETHRYARFQQTPASALGSEIEAVDTEVKLFSINAVQSPLESLLFSLAGDAGLHLRIFGQLSAKITLNSQQQTMSTLLDALSDQAGFSWQRDKSELMIWSGVSYGHSYPVNYLNMNRRIESRVGLATQVGTINAADDSVGSVANSSQTRVENSSEHQFWDSLEIDIATLVTADDADSDVPAESPHFSINKEAGLLTLIAEPAVHRTVQRYLKKLHGSAQRQVLIEATVVEVTLSDSFEAGVDWQILAKGIDGISAAQVLTGSPLVNAQNVGRLSAPAGLLSLVQQGSNRDVQATLSLLEQFGDTRILSRPRIIALNNQSSILKVVDNKVYFTVNVQRRQSENDDEIQTESVIHTVPVGLVMNVTPQISEQGSVMLNVRPTLSRILGFVNDPNPELAQVNVRNSVPEIQVREMETMLQVQSGHVAIIGGLMQETHANNDAQLPGLGRLPVIGGLFKKQSKARQQTELLIVLRPTVIQNHGMQASR